MLILNHSFALDLLRKSHRSLSTICCTAIASNVHLALSLRIDISHPTADPFSAVQHTTPVDTEPAADWHSKSNTLGSLIKAGAQRLQEAGVAFGHGTDNAYDEAAWLVLWRLGLPLDTPLADGDSISDQNHIVTPDQQALVAMLFEDRIASRKPAAYLTREAWLQGVPFYVDERAIVPRSFIAELISDGGFDDWLGENTHHVLDLCTGNGSLAVLAAMAWPDVHVTAADISSDALEVARINVDKHGLQDRIRLQHSDGLADLPGPWDLILCNPPYVNAQSMAALPPEYQAEPVLALAGGSDGMDFIRTLLAQSGERMSEHAVLVLEIGNERPFFEAAFPQLPVFWLDTSAGDEQVILITRQALIRFFSS